MGTLHPRGYGYSRPLGSPKADRRVEVHVMTEKEAELLKTEAANASPEQRVQLLQMMNATPAKHGVHADGETLRTAAGGQGLGASTQASVRAAVRDHQANTNARTNTNGNANAGDGENSARRYQPAHQGQLMPARPTAGS